jgi:hypothetical protein
VAGASLTLLAALGDKCLLRRNAHGRHEIHELLRQYAEEKLRAGPAEYEAVRDRHCRYYAELMVQHKTQLTGEQPEAVLSRLDLERENVRAAWNWAVEHRRVEEVNQFMEVL